MKNWILILVLSVMTVGYVNAQKSTLQKQGTATQLVVDGKTFLILGGELGASVTSQWMKRPVTSISLKAIQVMGSALLSMLVMNMLTV